MATNKSKDMIDINATREEREAPSCVLVMIAPDSM